MTTVGRVTAPSSPLSAQREFQADTCTTVTFCLAFVAADQTSTPTDWVDRAFRTIWKRKACTNTSAVHSLTKFL